MSVRNPCGQPLRCRQCSMCSTCYSSVPTRKAFRDSTNGNDTERNKSYTSNIVGKAFRYRTNGNDTERNKSHTSNIVVTGEVGRKGSVHSFLTINFRPYQWVPVLVSIH